MPTCKDCKFFEPTSKTKGKCFGHEVPANRDTDKCPAKAFKPKGK